MSKHEFVFLYIEHYKLGVSMLFVYLPVVLFLFRKQIYSIFDPMFFFFVISLCAHTVVFFLFYLDYLKFEYFFSFILTESFFIVGWLLNKPICFKTIKPKKLVYTGISTYFYVFSTCLFITSQLLVYLFKGVPLFMEHRLETFKDGSGFGFLGRIIFVTSIITLSIALFRLIYLKKSFLSSFFDTCVVFFYLISQVLSGSKAGLLFFVFTMFTVMFYAKKINIDRRSEIKYKYLMYIFACLSIPLGVFTIVIQNGDGSSILNAFTTLALRFINTGDIYYLSWVNDNVDLFHSSYSDGILALLSDPLGTLRLLPREELPQHLGLQVMWAVNGTDTFDGPNLRHNVFGLFYFGEYFAPFYSFCLGYLVGFIRNSVYSYLPNNLVGLSFYAIIFQISLYIPQDFSSLALSYAFSTFLIFPCLVIGSVLLKFASTPQRNPKRIV